MALLVSISLLSRIATASQLCGGRGSQGGNSCGGRVVRGYSCVGRGSQGGNSCGGTYSSQGDNRVGVGVVRGVHVWGVGVIRGVTRVGIGVGGVLAI